MTDVAATVSDIEAKLGRTAELLADPARRTLKTRAGIYYGEKPVGGKLGEWIPLLSNTSAPRSGSKSWTAGQRPEQLSVKVESL